MNSQSKKIYDAMLNHKEAGHDWEDSLDYVAQDFKITPEEVEEVFDSLRLNENVESKLTEGLRQGSLEDLIDNVINIDEYKSKILHDDESIVIVITTASKEAAFDLSSFIEKSPYNFIDTEVSDAPNQFGKYNVFCEIERNKGFVKQIIMIFKNIKKITNQDEWFFTAYKMPGKRPLTSKELIQNIRLEKMLPKVEDIPVELSEMDKSDQAVLKWANDEY